MNTQSSLRFSLATLAMLVYLTLANLANGLYGGLGIQPSPIFQLISTVAFVWVLGWWLIEDNKKYRLTWVQNYSVLLYVIGWIIIPVYLFRTRGTKAFLPILLFIGIYVGTFIFGIVIALVINILRNL